MLEEREKGRAARMKPTNWRKPEFMEMFYAQRMGDLFPGEGSAPGHLNHLLNEGGDVAKFSGVSRKDFPDIRKGY